uniref:Envelope protein n=1 Tax=Pelusios castaneus TaxID=367368 RepID=A0A8C8SBZ1_9SAUR
LMAKPMRLPPLVLFATVNAGWEQNSFLKASQAVASAGNYSNCWICTHSLSHLEQGLPLLGIPASTPWLKSNISYLSTLSYKGQLSSPTNLERSLKIRIIAALCIRVNHTYGSLFVGTTQMCEYLLDYSGNKTFLMISKNHTAIGHTTEGGEEGSEDSLTSWTSYRITLNNVTTQICNNGWILQPSARDCYNNPINLLDGSPSTTLWASVVCRRFKNKHPEIWGLTCKNGTEPLCPILSEQGLYWLCGSNAYKTHTSNWTGTCILGRVVPGSQVVNTVYSHHVRNLGHHVKRSENPLAARNTGFHQFMSIMLPNLGIYELERAIVNLSAALEAIENATADVLTTLKEEVTQLSQVGIQNGMALDFLLASQGGVCALVNSTCCVFMNQNKRIETDIKTIQNQLKVIHQVASENINWGPDTFWAWLTSWLPDLGALGRKIMYGLIMILFLIVLIYVIIMLFHCCTSTPITNCT